MNYRRILCLVTSMSLGVSVLAADGATVLQMQRQAAEFYRARRYQEAADLYKRVKDIQPKNVDVLKDLMWSLWKSGNAQETIDVAHQITTLDPNDTEAFSVLAKAYQASGDTKQGIENYRKVLAKESMNAQVKLALGRLYTSQGNLDEAERLLKEAAAEAPGNPEVLPALARLQNLRGDYKSSAASWERAVQQSPYNSDYKFHQAYALYRSGKRPEAMSIFRELLDDKDQNRRALAVLVNEAMEAGRLDTAADLLKRHLGSTTQKGDQVRLLRLARLYEEMGQTDEVISTVDQLLKINPTQYQALTLKADILFEHKRAYAEAAQLYKSAAENGPDNPRVYAKLATAQFIQGDFAQSSQSWGRAIELSPSRSDFKFKQAEAFYFGKQYDKAIPMFRSLLKDPDQKNRALDFLIGDAFARKDLPGAARLMEGNNDKLLQLAYIYRDLNQIQKSLATAEKYIAQHPEDGQALTFKGTLLKTLGRNKEAVRLYQKLVALNPESDFFSLQLAETYYNAGNKEKAVEMVERTRKLDPANPYLVFKEAAYMHDIGDDAPAKALVDNWLKSNKEPYLPVLVYHGLTPYGRDPMLSNAYHLPVATFEDQIRSLKKAGFVSVTCKQVDAWLRGKGELPEKPVLISFDDGRQDSFRNADPILKAYGMTATAFIVVWSTDRNLPNYANWDDLRKWKSTGRWDIQAHGGNSHTYIPIDNKGGKKLFLPSRMWLQEKNRLETEDEWMERVLADHKAARDKIIKEIPDATPIGFAFPEGDYGQFNLMSLPSPRKNVELVRRVYPLTFFETEYGINVRSKNAAVLTRFQPLQNHTGAMLVQHMTDSNPFSIARQRLLQWAVWEGKPREALSQLDALKQGGASEYRQLTNQALIHASRSDMTTAQTLAYRASQIAQPAEKTQPVEMIKSRNRLVWKPAGEYEAESHDRERVAFIQSLEFLHIKNTAWRLLHRLERYKEEKVPTINAHGFGLGMTLAMGLYNNLDVQGMIHNLSNGKDDAHTLAGSFQSSWSDNFQTVLRARRTPIMTARALNRELDVRSANAEVRWTPLDMWDFRVNVGGSRYSDNNDRGTGVFEGSRYVTRKDGFRLGYRFTADDAEKDSLDYYAPQNLRQHQVGFDAPIFGKGPYQCRIVYWPGIGHEDGLGSRVVHSGEIDLTQRWRENIGYTVIVGYDSTPTYHSFHSRAGFEFRF